MDLILETQIEQMSNSNHLYSGIVCYRIFSEDLVTSSRLFENN